ncbi:MAG: YcaO-like family protein [Bacillota bacterium]
MPTTLARFLDQANRFVSPRTGLVLTVVDRCLEHGDAQIHMARTETATTSRYGLPVDAPNRNGGAGLTRDAARASAIGETIERYACSVYDEEAFLLSGHASLPGRGVEPALLRYYSPAQYASPGFPFSPLSETTPIRWRQAVSLRSGEPVWYPAGLTHVPYVWHEVETPFAPSLTTGMALGATPLEAALTGLCEVVERDAFMITWWNRLSGREITVDPSSPLGQIMAEHFTVPGLSFRLFDITTDAGLPVVLCVALEERNTGCSLTVGAACRPDPTQAALKALIEAAKGRNTQRLVAHLSGPLQVGGWDEIRSLDDHARLYARHDMRPALNFLLETERRVELAALPSLETGDPAATLRRSLDAVGATGLEPLAMDLTPADVAEAGLAAVKVAIPGMVELNPWHSLRCFGSRRLYDAPVRMGYRHTPLAEQELNPFPHPFP